MGKKTSDTIQVARITMIGTVLVAVVGLVGTLVLGYWQFAAEPGETTQAALTQESDSLSIEQIPLEVFSFAGNNNPEGGGSTFVLFYEDAHMPIYGFDYSLPMDKTGYAGFAFRFLEPQDLSTYKAVEATVSLDQLNDEVDLYIKDMTWAEGKVHIVATGTKEMVLRYELTNFDPVNVNAIKEVGFFSETKFTTGDHQVRIKNIHFVQ